jgi:hypothetical protein
MPLVGANNARLKMRARPSTIPGRINRRPTHVRFMYRLPRQRFIIVAVRCRRQLAEIEPEREQGN